MVYTYIIDSVNSSPHFDQIAAYFSIPVQWRIVQRCVIALQNIPEVKQKTFHFQLVDGVNWPNGRAMKSEMEKKRLPSETVRTTKQNFIVILCKLEFSSSSKKQTGGLGIMYLQYWLLSDSENIIARELHLFRLVASLTEVAIMSYALVLLQGHPT